MKLITVIFFSLITLIQTVNAQESVYTRFGLGDVQFSYSGRRLGMGQMGTSVSDEDFISTLNPAGWNKLKMTRIEFGVAYNGSFVSDNSGNKFYAATKFTGFTMAFPASTQYGIGIAMGIVPVTFVNYQVNEHGTDPNPSVGDYTISYQGTGGLSKVFLGSSYMLPLLDINIGATLDYYFGNVNYSSTISFTGTSNLSATYQRTYQPKGIGTTLGFISPDFLSGVGTTFSDLRIGASINIIPKINADTLLTSSSTLRTDTVTSAVLDMKIPYTLNAGASVTINKKYLVTIDVAYQPWSEYTLGNIKPANMRNMLLLSAGTEYRPIRELGSSFWNQLILRGGVSYEQTQYFVNNTGINQVSVYGGFSVPLSYANTFDVGIQYSTRGTTDALLIKESGLKIAFGLSLGDLWFLRDEK
jgi:hypothetical protein